VPKILVLSDTHLGESEGLPELILQVGRSVDLIIHVGDFVSLRCFEELNQLAPLVGVRGNMDAGPLAARLPERYILELEDRSIGITHGHLADGNVLSGVRNMFQNTDLIIFGHTHIPFNGQIDGVRMFNPGSLTRPRATTLGTYGLVEMESDEIVCEIRALSENYIPYSHPDLKSTQSSARRP